MRSFKDRFNKILLQEAMSPSPSPESGEATGPEQGQSRPRYDSSEDASAFEAGLDPETDPSAYDVDGLGEELESAVDKTTQQVIEWADEIESFTKRLLDPENPEALLTKLTSVTDIPEYATAAEAVAKHLRKAISEIGSAKTELDVLASMASSRRNLRQQADNAQSGPSGPY
jgi:hypothetical protein